MSNFLTVSLIAVGVVIAYKLITVTVAYLFRDKIKRGLNMFLGSPPLDGIKNNIKSLQDYTTERIATISEKQEYEADLLSRFSREILSSVRYMYISIEALQAEIIKLKNPKMSAPKAAQQKKTLPTIKVKSAVKKTSKKPEKRKDK